MGTIEEQLSRYGDFLDEMAEDRIAPPTSTEPGPAEESTGARWGRALLVAAVVLPALLGTTLLLRPDPTVTIGAGTGLPVALVPDAAPEGMNLVRANIAPYNSEHGVLVLGPTDATADGRNLVLIETSRPAGGSSMSLGAGTDVATEVQGLPATLSRDGRVSVLQWSDRDHDIRVHGGTTIDEGTLRRIAEGLSPPDDGRVTPNFLPDGWSTLWDGLDESVTFDTSSYSYSDGARARFDVTTWSGAPDGAVYGIRYPVQARPVAIRRVGGFLDESDYANPFLWWVERPGVVVLVQHSGGDTLSAIAFADQLREVDADGWADFLQDIEAEPTNEVATTTPATPLTPADGTRPVPDVVGVSVADARRHLDAAGLEGSVAVIDSADPSATVIAQEPPGGEAVRPGAPVGLRTAAPAPAPALQCPSAVHPRPAGDSADGQPTPDATNLDDARTLAATARPELFASYPSATHVYLAHRDGDVRPANPDGGAEIGQATVYQIVVLLTDPADCPSAPTSIGLPITFLVE